MGKNRKSRKRNRHSLEDTLGSGLDKVKYKLCNAFFGALVFVILYIVLIADMDRNFEKMYWIFLLSIAGGFIVSMFFRMKFHNFDIDFNLQHLFKRIVISLFQTFYIYFALSSWFTDFSLYEIDSFVDFWMIFINGEFYAYLLFLTIFKIVIGWFADLVADKITFGG